MSLLSTCVQYYKFEGNVNNSVSGSYNGTATNVSYKSNFGIIQKGVGFDGSTSHITFPHNSVISAATKLSLSWWVMFPSTLTVNEYICSKDDTNQYSFQYLTVGSEMRSLIFTAASGASNAFGISSGLGLVPFTWYHMVSVYDGTATGNANRLKLYVNGVQITLNFTGTIPASLTTSTGLLKLSYYANANNMNSLFDEFAIFSDAITAANVTSLYNSGLGITYPFDGSIFPNADAYALSTWLLTSGYQKFTPARITVITSIQTAALNNTSTSLHNWNQFIMVAGQFLPTWQISRMVQ